ncbi:MAG: aspartyl protease family protein [Acidobacteria bacterium]|nr:aspartyl protease family protein [Acidobacteriota bacterium]
MKYEIFLTSVLRFPLRDRFTARAILICAVFIYPLSIAFTLAAQSKNDETRQLVKQAKKFVRRGEFSEAEKLLRRAVETSAQESGKDGTDAKLNLAYALLKQQQLREAHELSLAIARSEPKNASAFAILGTIFLNAGNFRDARLALLSALQIDDRQALAWAGLGTLSFFENKIQIGLSQLQTAVFLEPSEPDFLFTLAQVASRAEDFKQSAEAYERFLQISPQTDVERRARIKGLISFLRFLGNKKSLYSLRGAPESSINFRLVNDRPIIQLKINGRESEPLNFVIDTGSGISVISEETAQRLKIKAITRGGFARGVGGDGKFEIVYGFLRSVAVGAVEIRSVPVYIRRFHQNNDKIDGYVGLSLISKFLTTIDYGNLTFALRKKDKESGGDLKKQDGGENQKNEAVSIPLRLTSSGFLSGEVLLGGVEVPFNFIVDTGASISVISNEIAGLQEMKPFAGKEKVRVVGAAGVIEDMPSYILPKISFGEHSRERVKAVALNLSVINETSGFEQAGILGGNFLKNYRLTFDFANSKVVFVPIK